MLWRGQAYLLEPIEISKRNKKVQKLVESNLILQVSTLLYQSHQKTHLSLESLFLLHSI
jgi:hypothetical protein